MGSFEEVSALCARIRDCSKCPDISENMRRNISKPVGGSGSASAPVIVIGGGPTELDCIPSVGTPRPWAGPSGWRLVQMLAHAVHHAGLTDRELQAVFDTRPVGNASVRATEEYRSALHASLERAFFFTNNVRCLAVGGKYPKSAYANCATWTSETIYTVDPVLIIAIGVGVAEDLLGTRPDPHACRDPGKMYQYGTVSAKTGRSVPYALICVHTMQELVAANDQKTIKTHGLHHVWRQQVAHALGLVNTCLVASGCSGIWDKRFAKVRLDTGI